LTTVNKRKEASSVEERGWWGDVERDVLVVVSGGR